MCLDFYISFTILKQMLNYVEYAHIHESCTLCLFDTCMSSKRNFSYCDQNCDQNSQITTMGLSKLWKLSPSHQWLILVNVWYKTYMYSIWYLSIDEQKSDQCKCKHVFIYYTLLAKPWKNLSKLLLDCYFIFMTKKWPKLIGYMYTHKTHIWLTIILQS